MTDPTVPTPELDRQLAILGTGRAQAVQEFYDWLQAQGLHLCAWTEDLTESTPCPDAVTPGKHAPRFGCVDGKRARFGETTGQDGQDYGACPRCAGRGYIERPIRPRWVEDPRSPERLVADHFGIDLRKIEAERRAILDAIRQGATR
jgi:hypothetical protein